MLLMLEGGSTISSAMSTALGTIATDAVSMIATIVPVAAPILGGIVVIGIGIKAFKAIKGK